MVMSVFFDRLIKNVYIQVTKPIKSKGFECGLCSYGRSRANNKSAQNRCGVT